MATVTIALGKVAYPHVTDGTEVLTARHGGTEAVVWAVGFLWQRNTDPCALNIWTRETGRYSFHKDGCMSENAC